MNYITKGEDKKMMDEKEIQDTFELLGIKIKKSDEKENNFSGFIDKKPLRVKYQTTTSIDT